MNNWQLIITLATFILAVFAAGWLNQNLMNKRIDDLKMYLDAKFDAVNAKFDTVNERFKAIDQRFAAIESRLDRIERQLETIFKPSLPGR